MVYSQVNVDEPVKSRHADGFAKSAEIKACESLVMRRTYVYSAVTRDEAQHRYRTFYGTVNVDHEIATG